MIRPCLYLIPMVLWACSGDDASPAGGSQTSGGTQATGGSLGSGGIAASGGVLVTGGQVATGGQSGTGGVNVTGGSGLSAAILARLPGPMLPATEVVESCRNVENMSPCSLSLTPEIPGLSVCISEKCSKLGNGEGFVDPTGPYFPWPRPGESGFSRSSGDEPVVQDNITTLMWQGCLAGLHGANCEEGTAVEIDNPTLGRTYCDELTWGGYDDWVYPDAFAVISLIDMGVPREPVTVLEDGSLVAGDFPEHGHALPREAFPRPTDGWLTTSTGEPGGYFWVNTATGIVDDNPLNEDREMWPVSAMCMRLTQLPSPAPDRRSLAVTTKGELIGPNNLEDPFVLFDVVTRTLWEAGPRELTRDEAIRFCMELNYAGVNGWRLPDVKELFGILEWSGGFINTTEHLRTWNDISVNASSGSSSTKASAAPWPVRCVYYPE